MKSTAIIMMSIFIMVIWGGFIFSLIIALRREREKGSEISEN